MYIMYNNYNMYNKYNMFNMYNIQVDMRVLTFDVPPQEVNKICNSIQYFYIEIFNINIP